MVRNCVVDPSHWPTLVSLLDLLSGDQAVRCAHVSQISPGSRDDSLSGVGSTPFISVTPGPASTHTTSTCLPEMCDDLMKGFSHVWLGSWLISRADNETVCSGEKTCHFTQSLLAHVSWFTMWDLKKCSVYLGRMNNWDQRPFIN